MGMGLFKSYARSAERAREASRNRLRVGVLLPGDPNPGRFEIQSCERFGPYIVAEITWPDAKNYEGRKIAVYRATPDQLRKATWLDPHFQENGGPLAPIARLEPTQLGLALARACARQLESAG